jgi:hypothetical protein
MAINVTVSQPGIINVKVANQGQRVDAISYGSRKIRDAIDLDMSRAQADGFISYVSATDSFAVVSTLDQGNF